MCQWGTDKIIHVIRRNNDAIPDGWYEMAVDACIADYVQAMNNLGIITVSCCCGHGNSPGVVLVALESAALMQQYGYGYHDFEGRSLEHEIPQIAALPGEPEPG